MEASECRREFLDFFEENDHQIQDSAPLLPSDPELLFNIAGMVPFKPYFLGEDEPPSTRVTTSQKCIRTEDIENIGFTERHLTFFEMLGNFSFGDYFKTEAIKLAWAFLTNRLEIEESKLWISVFEGDEEQGLKPDTDAIEIWRNEVGIPEDRILKLGTAENFWAMGETGPCGPCSEIMYDLGGEPIPPDEVKQSILQGEDRFLELWNLVFMEFDRDEDGTLTPLPNQNIDTGMGLKRLAAVMQGEKTHFKTDLFQPIIRDTRELAELPSLDDASEYRDVGETRVAEFPDQGIEGQQAVKQHRAQRIIADHMRSATFLLAEGLMPGNEGRGYVLRRLIRRAIRWGRSLGFDEPFLNELVPGVIDIMGDHYSELRDNQRRVQRRMEAEEEQFFRTLRKGLNQLRSVLDDKRPGENRVSGEEVFELYETHGLPVEVTTDVLEDEGYEFDEDEIQEAREKHQQRSRGSWEGQWEQTDLPLKDFPETDFVGYEHFEVEAEIIGLFHDGQQVDELESGCEGYLLLDRTPFYPEGGGQVGDRGRIGDFSVEDTQKKSDRIVHVGQSEGTVRVGETVTARVEESRRRSTMRHHTATHLLQSALRNELGDGVMQDGSLVDAHHLRFDFTHERRVTEEELQR
ncbi:MAG: alanine--tRNA ligase, partial [bacterium]